MSAPVQSKARATTTPTTAMPSTGGTQQRRETTPDLLPKPLLSPSLLADLVAACRMRRQYQQAELRLGNQLRSLLRSAGIGVAGGPDHLSDQWAPDNQRLSVAEATASTDQCFNDTHDDVVGAGSVALLRAHFEQFAKPIRAERLRCEKTIRQLSAGLSVAQWIDDPARRGLGVLGLGLLIGETGDLTAYANPAKVWKRLGLAVFDGKPQRRIAGTTKEKTAEAIAHGYSPRRRSLMHVIGDALVKQNQDGPYRTLYLARKEHELGRLPKDEKTRVMHAHRRAMRYMEKRLIVDLWRAWRLTTTRPGFKSKRSL